MRQQFYGQANPICGLIIPNMWTPVPGVTVTTLTDSFFQLGFVCMFASNKITHSRNEYRN